MIDPKAIRFPLNMPEFVRLQRNEMRRFPTTEEMEIFAQIVKTANEAYYAAADGEADTVADILEAVSYAAAPRPGTDKAFAAVNAAVAAMCRGWLQLAIRAGTDALKEKIDREEAQRASE